VWPERSTTNPLTAEQTARIDALLEKMTLEQKVGQLIIADISSLVPEELSSYPLGAVLAGGNSAPSGQRFTDMDGWLSFADDLYSASENYEAEVFVPPLFGIDALHGHNNVLGAVVFPHNISLGAVNDRQLTHKIGSATARALAATGHDWTFAPTVAVAQDMRWGRTYESYSSDPARVHALTKAFVRGIQSENTGNGMILATAKHFIADGGTVNGKDQGDTRISETDLASIHGPGFFAALDEGVATIMASYSSWNNQKLHGHEYLLQTILKERLAFDGFVVGDWDAHAQLEGCTPSDCASSINAGVDMLMAPNEWKLLFASLLEHVKQGEITSERLNDAARRILAVKLRSGLLDSKIPSQRKGAGDTTAIDGPEIRALAREAVRSSQVLLKNDNNILPIRNLSKISVIGVGADDIPIQCGGWCLSWQSDGLTRDNFTQGKTILDGIRAHAAIENIEIIYDGEGQDHQETDLAIVVLHTKPYAEYYGDIKKLEIPNYNEEALKAISYYHSIQTPVVTILISGRPLWTEDQITLSSAFIASWLPGTQGDGIADILFGKTLDGTPVNLTGKLPFPWLRDNSFRPTLEQPALFDVDYGLEYPQIKTVGRVTQADQSKIQKRSSGL